MEVHILSLFWESIKPYLNASIMKIAQEKGLFQYFIHNICDWSVRNTRRVDDRPYGWWAGTIITIEPLTLALREILLQYGEMDIYYMSPRGNLLNQEYSENIVQTKEKLCIICGHYEWIDERIFSLFPIQEISIGEYVISSWELSAIVFIDSIIRLVPWVINEESLSEESFSKKLQRKKEYPQYSRPEVYENISVPSILLSWDQKKIQLWKESNTRD
jgi:tRNA (guanine37-N1)-methyltransferase